jgi:hypothetical protein
MQQPQYTIIIYKNGEKTYLDDNMQNTNDRSKAWRMSYDEALERASRWYGAENAHKYIERI